LAITHVAARALVDLLADRKSEWTDLWFVGRPPPDNGPPGFARDAIARWTLRSVVRADDEGREVKTPLPMRLMTLLSRRSPRGRRSD
jgi:hypothetical protein